MKEYFRTDLILRPQITLILIMFIINLSFNDLFSQNVQAKPSRQSSLEAFSDGKYELAYNQFSELLISYPKDPLYKYYSGVCLVKLNRDPEKASSLLQQAMQGAAAVRTVPADAVFYLGRAQQMSGRFSEALESYTRFGELSGKKAAKELGVPEYIQQCNNKNGQLLQSETGKTINSGEEDSDAEIIAETALPPDYEKLLDAALSFQFKADSLLGIAAKQKQGLVKVPDNQKAAVRKRISEIELLAASYQKEADRIYNEAEFLKDGRSVEAKVTDFKTDSPKDSVTGNNNVLKIAEIKESGIIKDTVRTKKENQQPETKVAIDPVNNANTKIEPILKNEKTVELFSVFKIIEKPVFSVSDKITINPQVPEGLVYRIQVAVFRNPVAPSYFRGITPVYGFRVTGTERTNYYAGMFRRSSDAAKAVTAVRYNGFKDAFVVAFSGTKPVSAERAVVLEKEWGKRPLIKELKAASGTMRDTLPPTLIFRIEVIRSLKPLKDEITEEIKKISGNRGMDILIADDGKFVYLIGKFITFESAAEYNDLLIRNGYREAKVVAWMGRNEIPVETARQLFEKLE